MKLPDVIPVYKPNEKNERVFKKNYRPVSLTPIVSKAIARNMFTEISQYIDKFLSPYPFGYRKGYITEQCLVTMIEFRRKSLDSKYSTGAILKYLSIAKLAAYGFEDSALGFIFNYLKERKQHTKIGDSYSSWRELKHGVPQGSILGPLVFNIFINDIFFFIDKTKFANYADDTIVYSKEDNITKLLHLLETETSAVLNWFLINEMKANDDRCHLIVAYKEDISIHVGQDIIKSSDSVKLLGVCIDKQLNFNEHVSKLCKKGNQKF